MWKKILCWCLGHVPDLINVVGTVVRCERCKSAVGTTVAPEPVVTITTPPKP